MEGCIVAKVFDHPVKEEGEKHRARGAPLLYSNMGGKGRGQAACCLNLGGTIMVHSPDATQKVSWDPKLLG